MKRIPLLFLLIALLLLSGCTSKVPEHMKNPKTEFLVVEDYKRPDYSVPENYRLIKNGIYAVLDESENITGFMKLVEKEGVYTWVESSFEEAYQ